MNNKLKRQRDFDAVFNKGKRARADCISMFYLKTNSDITKIGISISKKHGGAVQRNRIKRLIRAVYIPMFPRIKKGYNIVFLPKISEEYSYHAFLRSIEYLLRKEKLSDEVLQ